MAPALARWRNRGRPRRLLNRIFRGAGVPFSRQAPTRRSFRKTSIDSSASTAHADSHGAGDKEQNLVTTRPSKGSPLNQTAHGRCVYIIAPGAYPSVRLERPAGVYVCTRVTANTVAARVSRVPAALTQPVSFVLLPSALAVLWFPFQCLYKMRPSPARDVKHQTPSNTTKGQYLIRPLATAESPLPIALRDA